MSPPDDLRLEGPLPARPPFMGLPTPLTPTECMALHAVAGSMATDRADLSHTKTAVNEARAFQDIALKRNGRDDYGGTREALVRAAAILIRAIAALDLRYDAERDAAHEAHAAALEDMYAKALARRVDR